jgi:hypothetical protein
LSADYQASVSDPGLTIIAAGNTGYDAIAAILVALPA